MPYTLVVAEKPSVARDLARVIGCKTKGDGYFEGGAWRVTWALGHLVSLCEPEEIDEKWKRWKTETLPILPDAIPLKVLPKTKKQYNCVKHLMLDQECTDLVCATDAGREGELIFRYLIHMAGCRKPCRRLWISSMTDEAIREGFAHLKPSSEYDLLYQSARCRSEADWLVGMNASRAFTLRYGALLSIGRVQTPTLALLVRRHHEIAAFVPQDFWVLTAHFGDYSGQWLHEKTNERRLYSPEEAQKISEKVRGKEGCVELSESTPKRELPPQLYDLTSLQRDANRFLGLTAQKTLDIAQKLYEDYKLLTYPRTDSRYLPRDMAGRTRSAISSLGEPYASLASVLLEKPLPMSPRIFDDAKVSDHHALIPTGKRFDPQKLPADAAAVMDLVVRRLLAAFYPEYRYDALRVITRVEGEPFVSLGRRERQAGWKAVVRDLPSKQKKEAAEDEQTLPDLAQGDRRQVQKTTIKADQTKPPALYTDASLLSAMEHAERELEDEALRESLKRCGLGTPATRAAIIERLLKVGYVQRRGRSLMATEKGVRLIAVVPSDIASPEITGRWEKALTDITTGGMDPERFLGGIRRLSVSLVESAAKASDEVSFEKEERRRSKRRGTGPSLGVPCPLCGQGHVLENSKAFYCSRWMDGCRLTLWKDCCVRSGGPVLTAALVARLLKEGSLRGSTGTIYHSKGSITFSPKT